jgi:hypothetical protein
MNKFKETSIQNIYNDLKKDLDYDFEDNLFSVVHCFERHNTPRHEQHNEFLARQNDINMYHEDLTQYLLRCRKENEMTETKQIKKEINETIQQKEAKMPKTAKNAVERQALPELKKERTYVVDVYEVLKKCLMINSGTSAKGRDWKMACVKKDKLFDEDLVWLLEEIGCFENKN